MINDEFLTFWLFLEKVCKIYRNLYVFNVILRRNIHHRCYAPQIGHSLFAALRQNRVPKNIFGRSFIFALWAQK
jgi:hypothetical protein